MTRHQGSARTARARRACATAAGAALALALALAILGPAPARTQEAVDFAGETLTIVIPYGPGGGGNLHGRLFATALEETLPGQPTIVVENIEGGGSIRGTNEFARQARPDGRMFLEIGGSTLLNSLFRDPSVQYELAEFEPFLSSPTGSIVYGRTDHAGGLGDDPVENIRAFIADPPVIASQSITSSDLGMLFSYDLLGIEPTVAFGISLGESRAGLERAEFQMRHDTTISYADEVQPLVEDGTVKLLFSMGFEVDGEIVRDPNLPDVPHFLEVYEAIHGEKLSGIEYDVWMALFNLRVMAGKMLLLAPGTPPEIVAAYSEATEKALALPSMTDDTARTIIGEYPQVTGVEAKRILVGALDLAPEHVEWLREWAARTHGSEIR